LNKLIYFNDKNEEVVFKENITEEEIETFLTAAEVLFETMNSIDYYNIVKDNIVELIEAIIDYDVNAKKAFPTINRYFFNMLNSFYCYVKYYERFHSNKYKHVFSNQFDKYDTYKLVSELRKYTTHCFMAITKASVDLLTGKVSIQIIPKDLLTKDAGMLRKDVKEILKKYVETGEVIDLRLLTSEFLNIFCELQVKIMDEMKIEIMKNMDIVEKYIYGKNMNKKESYILKEDGTAINTSNILIMTLKKFQEEYVPNDRTLELLKKLHE